MDFQDETQFGSDKIRSIKYMKQSEAWVLIFLVILGTEASDRKRNKDKEYVWIFFSDKFEAYKIYET